jgi:hypothetical protein
MSYTPKSLFSVIHQINRDIFLPHIQRPFVWEISQMSKLFDSLMRGYPIQTLLFWKTNEAIKARKFMSPIDEDIELHTLYEPTISEAGPEKIFVLDGQQRLQTLLCIYNGTIKVNGVLSEAYIDITSVTIDSNTGQIFNLDFLPVGGTHSTKMFRVRDLMTRHEKRNAEDISDEINSLLDEEEGDNPSRKERERNVRKNVSMMVSILREDKHFWIETLDGIANLYPYRTILEIFVRVNSGGTKLDASDLMFAAMKELSSEIETNLEEMSTTLSVGNLNFEVETLLKCILLVNNKGASVDQEKFVGEAGRALVSTIDGQWDTRYRPAFEALKDFIVVDLKLDSDKIIRSYNSFVPIFEYFFSNPTPTPENKSRLKAFYYKAQLFNWFSAQTDGILDYLHNNFLRDVTRQDFPVGAISVYFESRKKHSTFDKATLTDHSLRFFLLHLLYVETLNSSAFNVLLKNNAPHIDHIYPKSKLARDPFNFSAADINHIGNYRFVGATDNIRKRAEVPASYFKRLKDAAIDIEKHLLLKAYSDDPAKLLMDRATYLSFRDERLERIFNIISPKINFI